MEVDIQKLRKVPGWPDYFASEDGQVFSSKYGRFHLMSTSVGSIGYPKLTLCRNGERKEFLLHQVIARTFLGPQKPGQVIRHLDGDQLNNASRNLAYGDYKDNEADKRRHGRSLFGSSANGAILTDELVMEARRRYAAGEAIKDLRASYGVSQDTILKAIHGYTWKHLPMVDYSDRPGRKPRAGVPKKRQHAKAATEQPHMDIAA